MLRLLEWHVIAYVAPTASKKAMFQSLQHYQEDSQVLQHNAAEVALVNGIGSLPQQTFRRDVFEHFTEKGFDFPAVVHPSAIVAQSVKLQAGVQVMAGAVINPESHIAQNTIVNTRCTVDHDCNIGQHNHLAPGATLSGGVTTGQNVHIGTGASVIQSITVHDNSIVGAGATVTQDVPKDSIVYPARSVVKDIKNKVDE